MKRPRRTLTIEIPAATANALARIVSNGRALTSGDPGGFASFDPRQFRADLERRDVVQFAIEAGE